MAGGFGARACLALALKCLKRFLPEVVELALDKPERIGVGQAHQVLCLVGFGGLAASSTRLTRLPLSEAVRRSASSGQRPRTGRLRRRRAAGSQPRGRAIHRARRPEAPGRPARSPGRARRRRRQRGGSVRSGNPRRPRCDRGFGGASGRVRSRGRRPRATTPCWPGRGERLLVA